jgi:hypothetical protein
MGTTTDIAIDVLSEKFALRSADKAQNEQIAILARNNHPMWNVKSATRRQGVFAPSASNTFVANVSRRRFGVVPDPALTL